ncbi:putative peroxisomal acyl-coenzyme A oxidase 1, partial [Araneus ventricosus]
MYQQVIPVDEAQIA